MTKIGNKMRVSFQYKDAETKKTVGHTFNDVNPNATVEAIRSVKEAIDAVWLKQRKPFKSLRTTKFSLNTKGAYNP